MNRKLRETLGLLALTAGFTIRFDVKGLRNRPIYNDPTMIFLLGNPIPYLDDRPAVTLVVGGMFGGVEAIRVRVETIAKSLADGRVNQPGEYRWTVIEQSPVKKPRVDINGVQWHTLTIVGMPKSPIF